MNRASKIRVGDAVRFRGTSRLVVKIAGDRVFLDGPVDGEELRLVDLVASPGFSLETPSLEGTVVDLAAFEALPPEVRSRALFLQGHVVDVVHGRAPDGSPNPYLPSGTSLRQRELAKVAELAGLGEDIELRKLQRLRVAYERHGLLGLVDRRQLRPHQAGARTDPRVREVIAEVLSSMTLESTGSADRIRLDVERRLAEKYGQDAVEMPSRASFYRFIEAMKEGRHALGSARTRRTLSQQPQREFSTLRASMPGEIVQVDSTALDVAVVLDGEVTGRVELTAMVDLATRTIMAVVVRPTTKAADLGALLAHAITPEPMRPGWPDSIRMSRSVLPYQAMKSIDSRLSEETAARPVIAPQTIVMDHGKQYTSRTFEHACRIFGISVQPAHPDKPTDKPVVERTLQSVATLFVQYLPGYLGRSVETRGQDAAKKAVYSVSELQNALDEWVVTVWQNRKHEGLRDPLSDGTLLSPNEMYAAMTQIAGYVPVPADAETFVELLPWESRKIGSEGIQINRRKYESPALNPYRGQRSTRRDGLWEIRHDPYDISRVFVRVDSTPERFITVPWKHLATEPVAFGADVWRAAQEQVAERTSRAGTETEIAEAAKAILNRQREKSAPTARSRKRSARIRARDQAAQEVRSVRPESQPANAPVVQEGPIPSGPEIQPQATGAETEERLADIVPLPVYDASKEAQTWW